MYRCPKCKSVSLEVCVTVWANLVQEPDNIQTEIDGGDHGWDERAPMQCRECRHNGEAKTFVAEPTSIEAFAKMVNDHDLTYSYSDDHRAWRAGQDSADALLKARADIPWEAARDIWNAAVDRKIVEGSREPFYWPKEPPKW